MEWNEETRKEWASNIRFVQGVHRKTLVVPADEVAAALEEIERQAESLRLIADDRRQVVRHLESRAEQAEQRITELGLLLSAAVQRRDVALSRIINARSALVDRGEVYHPEGNVCSHGIQWDLNCCWKCKDAQIDKALGQL